MTTNDPSIDDVAADSPVQVGVSEVIDVWYSHGWSYFEIPNADRCGPWYSVNVDTELQLYVDGDLVDSNRRCVGRGEGDPVEHHYTVSYEPPDRTPIELRLEMRLAGSDELLDYDEFAVDVEGVADLSYTSELSVPSEVSVGETFALDAEVCCEGDSNPASARCPLVDVEIGCTGTDPELLDETSAEYAGGACFSGFQTETTAVEPGDHVAWIDVGGDVTERSFTIVDDREPPVSGFSYSIEGMDALFDGAPSRSGDEPIETFAWTISGAEYTGETVEHSFETAGEHTVSLEVIDATGLTDTHSQRIDVAGESPPLPDPPSSQSNLALLAAAGGGALLLAGDSDSDTDSDGDGS